MIKFVTTLNNKKKIHAYYIVGQLFILTTRFCNLASSGDPIVEVTYDHCNTIEKNVSPLLYEIS
jgi:hypothetical protein